MEYSITEELNSMMKSISAAKIGDFQLTPQPLYNGTNGQIFHMTNRKDKKQKVLKVIWKTTKNTKNDKKTSNEFKNEKNIHQSLKNIYVITLEASFTDEYNNYLVLEYAHGEDLSKTIQKMANLSVENKMLKLKKYGLQIARGISYLHKNGIIHGDIKPQNILLTSSDDIKICDFGSSMKFSMNEKVKGSFGTLSYFAPEKIHSYDQKVDIWAFGCLLYETYVGKTPFQFNSWTQMTSLLTHQHLNALQFDANIINKQFSHLLKQIFRHDPSSRITIQDILKHPFFTGQIKSDQFYRKQNQKDQIDQIQERLKTQKIISQSVKSCELKSRSTTINPKNIGNVPQNNLKENNKGINTRDRNKSNNWLLIDNKQNEGLESNLTCERKVMLGEKKGVMLEKKDVMLEKKGEQKRGISPLVIGQMIIKPLKKGNLVVKIDQNGLTREDIYEDSQKRLFFNVSADGMHIRIKRKNVEKSFHLSNLPHKYHQHYQNCKKFLQIVQNQTPKISYTNNFIQMHIMYGTNVNVQIHSSKYSFQKQDLQDQITKDSKTAQNTKHQIEIPDLQKIKAIYKRLMDLEQIE